MSDNNDNMTPVVTNPIVGFILLVALESLCASMMWKYIFMPDFGLKSIPFGHFFIVVAALHIIANRLFVRLDYYGRLLVEIRELQIFIENNSSHKFGKIAEFMDKHFDKITRAAVDSDKK